MTEPPIRHRATSDPDPTSIRVRGAIAGDREQLEWLVAHFHPLVLAHVRLRLGGARARSEDVLDLADEVWLIALRRMRDLAPAGGRLTPVLARFLATTAVNLCNNHLRSRARRSPASATPEHSAAGPVDWPASESGVVTRASRGETNAAIAAALATLNDHQRSILVLRLLEGERNKDIAAILSITENAVAVHYRRALEAMRSALPRSTFEDLQRLGR